MQTPQGVVGAWAGRILEWDRHLVPPTTGTPTPMDEITACLAKRLHVRDTIVVLKTLTVFHLLLQVLLPPHPCRGAPPPPPSKEDKDILHPGRSAQNVVPGRVQR